MSRKQFDRMELLTDETEVDRTFLHSKLHAPIVHVPFYLCFSRTRPLRFHHFVLSPSLFTVPPAPITKSDRAQVASTYFCKNLGIPVSRERAREFEEKRERNAHRRYFKRRLPPISRDLIQDPPVSGPRHFVLRPTFQRNSLLFCFFPPIFFLKLDEQE